MQPCRHLSVAIDRPPADVYAFVSLVENLPVWVTSFCKGVRRANDGWRLQTPEGELGFRFAAENELGVLDHVVTPPTGEEVYVPLRVVANGGGSEVTLTLFRTAGMTGDRFARDAGMVESDLATLKRVLEG